MRKIRNFLMLEDRNVRNLVRQDRKENTRLETYKIISQ